MREKEKERDLRKETMYCSPAWDCGKCFFAVIDYTEPFPFVRCDGCAGLIVCAGYGSGCMSPVFK